MSTQPKTDSTDLVERATTSIDDQWDQSVALVERRSDGWLTKLPDKPVDMSPLGYLARLMEMLPEPTEDVIGKIAMQILTAGNKASENAIWDAVGSKDVVNQTFIWHAVHIHPTEFAEGLLPYFLACDVTDLSTGERTVLTTGSVNLCSSLIHAQLVGGLPWEGTVVGPRRPTKSGHVPLHMRWGSRIVSTPDQPEERDL